MEEEEEEVAEGRGILDEEFVDAKEGRAIDEDENEEGNPGRCCEEPEVWVARGATAPGATDVREGAVGEEEGADASALGTAGLEVEFILVDRRGVDGKSVCELERA